MKHEILAEFEDRRIEIVGVFDKFSTVQKTNRNIRTVLLQDAYANVDGKQYDLGHTWIQYADEFKSLNVLTGDRIRCNCRVTKYKKYLDIPNADGFRTETKYSLCYPNEIDIPDRCVASPEPLLQQVPEPPQPQPLEPTVSAAELIVEVRRVARLAGGFDCLKQLVDVLR